jgi:SAM-dependent methyltransferase
MEGGLSRSAHDGDRADRRAHWRARATTWHERAAGPDRERDARLNAALMEAAGVRPGARVLDLGAGGGQPAIALVQAVGAAGLVIALDHAPEMLAGAAARAAALDLAVLRCVVADMVELPFPDRSFDAVTARFSLMSVPDKPAALAEARRVLRPGGRIALLVWGPEDANDRFRALRRGALACFGPEVAGRPSGRHALGIRGAMSALLRGAGFTAVDERAVDDTSEVPADPRVWASSVRRNHADRLAAMDAAGRARLDDAMRAAFEPFRIDDVYRLRASATLASGAAPA